MIGSGKSISLTKRIARESFNVCGKKRLDWARSVQARAEQGLTGNVFLLWDGTGRVLRKKFGYRPLGWLMKKRPKLLIKFLIFIIDIITFYETLIWTKKIIFAVPVAKSGRYLVIFNFWDRMSQLLEKQDQAGLDRSASWLEFQGVKG